MAIDTAPAPSSPASAPRSSLPGEWRTRHRVVGWLLLLGWVAVVASSVALGTKESTYAELEARVASGEVAVVEVAGDHLPEDARATPPCRWSGVTGSSSTTRG